MPLFLPSTLELRSIHENWKISYTHAWRGKFKLEHISPYQLHLTGATNQRKLCYQLLEKFLKRKAYRHLHQWVQALSEDFDLEFSKITVRGQRTCWGSCSETGSINLNYKLLFLPATLVEYVLIHELCHTKYLDHSREFWNLVEHFDPNYREHRKLLQKPHAYLPGWVK